MPGLQVTTVPRRRRRVEDDEDGESSAASPEVTPLSRASTNGKRIRLESTRNEQNGDEDDEELSGDESESSTPAKQPRALKSDPDFSPTYDKHGYRTGAIVRVKLTDFVTYTSAEFSPGPKLNMIIGPNGTGKSTLVCAICLGLGWGPQHLGRAKDPGEFVKHGCREATIEIELAGEPRFRKNPVITRTIKRDGNKSSFTLNGKPTSRTQVLKFAQSFYIQIDNLCQFLPQDKVSEFAALTPIELLYSTQRAAAEPEVLEWHENLKKLRAEQKKLQIDNQGDRDLLANLESRQEMQRADVERVRQRDVIKRKVEMLETMRPLARYKEFHQSFKLVRQRKQNLEAELDRLEKQLEPQLRAVNVKEDYTVQMNAVVTYQAQLLQNTEAAAQDANAKIEQLEGQMRDMNGRIESEKKSGSKLRDDMKHVQQLINKLARQKNNEPVEFDPNFYNEKLKEKRQQLREVMLKAQELKDNRHPLVEQIFVRTSRIRRAEDELRNLDSQAGQQEAKLKQLSMDSFRAYEWILNNQDKFEKEVFGPPVVTCAMKDPNFADIIESMLQRTDLMAFTTQSRNDFRTLQRALNITMKLHDISIRTCTSPLANFQPPLSDHEIRTLGFGGWAKDYLTGPEPVLAMLCSENRLHQTPVSRQDVSDEQYNRIERSPITSWVSGKRIYNIIRRMEYGPKATSTRVRQVRDARIWANQPVDASAKRELQMNIQVWKDEIEECQKQIEGARGELNRLGDQNKALEAEKEALEKEKSIKQSALVHYKAIPEKIGQQQSKLRDFQKLMSEVRERVREIRVQQDKLSIQKAEATIAYAVTVEKLQRQQQDLIKLHVKGLEAASDLETLKTRNTRCHDLLDAKRTEADEAAAEFKKQSEIGVQLKAESRKVLVAAESQPDLKDLLPQVREMTIDQLEADIDSEKARLELTRGVDRSIVKEFEDREAQIQQLRSKLADFERTLSDYDHAIKEIRGKWEPRLDALIGKISDAFSDSFARIGCAGQVSLDKPEDEPGPHGQPGGSNFDQWSIQIHVKFREHENLCLLDSHRQSGGERAVSTIFYLMALQSLSASPFRVVDEINQGMDPRNERMVHERLVDIACAAGNDPNDKAANADNRGSQYFLITPKLLNNLVYKDGMKVSCIMSGEHMPENYATLYFSSAITLMNEITSRKKAHGKRKPAIPDSEVSFAVLN